VHALASLVFALAGIHVGSERLLPFGYAPAWSPSGARIAYVTRGDVWVADADGTHQGRIVRDADTPAWSPDGRRLAFVRGGFVWTVRADGLDEHRLALGAHPDWSPGGKRIAFDRGGVVRTVRWHGGDPRVAAHGEQPAYAPDGRLAFVRDGEIFVGRRRVAEGEQPTFAPDGRRLAWVRDGRVYLAGRAIGRGAQPDWRPNVRLQELLPDLDQRAPRGLAIQDGPGHWLLGFTSLVDNVGLGPVLIAGNRPPGERRMTADQRVLLTNDHWRTYTDVGHLRYTNSGNHHHWHLQHYDDFELRSLDGATLVRDRKSGFCLADHYGIAPGNWPGRKPFFLGSCAQYDPEARHLVEGTSLGFTDRYPAFFHGQNDDITNLPAGVYDLVHRVNETMALHEFRYENDAASVRLRLRWHKGVPSVTVLRWCPSTPKC
jgi:hypothetical protein